jgi:hypothetical protein
MRTLLKWWFFVLVMSLFIGNGPTEAASQGDETLKAFVERAIKAAGADKTSTVRSWTLTLKATDRLNPSRSGVRCVHVQLPDQYRSDVEFHSPPGDPPMRTSVVINGQTGWETIVSETKELSAEKVGRYKKKMQLLPDWSRDVALLSEPGYQPAMTTEVTIGGRVAVGIKLTRNAHPFSCLYLDKETGRLLKAERKREDGQRSETIYRDYRNVAGIQVPHKWTYRTDGKVDYESGKLRVTASVQPEDWVYELIDLKFADKLDTKLFEKP